MHSRRGVLTWTRREKLADTPAFKEGYLPFIDFTIQEMLFSTTLGRNISPGTTPSLMPWPVQEVFITANKHASKSADIIPASLAHLSLSICHYVGFGVERDLERVLFHIQESRQTWMPGSESNLKASACGFWNRVP
jgi:hypothetical protein